VNVMKVTAARLEFEKHDVSAIIGALSVHEMSTSSLEYYVTIPKYVIGTASIEGSECFRHPKESKSRYDQVLWTS